MDRSSSMESADGTDLSGKRKPEYESETKWTPKKPKEGSEVKTTQGFADNLLQEVKGRRAELAETNSEANETVEGVDETPHFVEGVVARKKTLILDNLSCQAKISDIINFFEDVGKVVQVRRVVDREGRNLGCGSVEFASADEAKKVLEQKNGYFFYGEKIILRSAKVSPYPQTPRFCLEHKVWYEDTIRRESFQIEEEETPPHFFQAREKRVFVANLSPQTKLFSIVKFFEEVGIVFSVRLIVNQEGKHVGFCFVEFADGNEAKMALEKKNGEYLHDHSIFLEGAKTAPSSPRPKYCIADMLWYEDILLQKSLDKTLEQNDETPNFVEAFALRKKTLFIDNLSGETEISDIINFFNARNVIHVRLIVNKSGKHLGYGFVQFVSARKAKEAREKKCGGYLCGNYIGLGKVEIARYKPGPMYCIDHKVWYEYYLHREGLLKEEEEAGEELDEFYEEASVRNKILFIDNIFAKCEIGDIARFFQDFGEVSVRLIVDSEGEHVGCGFVKFASAVEAKKALEKKKGEKVEIAPYPLQSKYTAAECFWYLDFLRKENLQDDDWQKKMNLPDIVTLWYSKS